MANPTWSEERKEYVNNLCRRRKKIWFFCFNVDTSALRWTLNKNEEYDIIFGYNKTIDVYIAMKADKIRNNKYISFNKALEKIDLKKIRNITYLQQNTNDYSEMLVIIPCRELESFCKAMDHYFEKGEKK